jgi:hypothetical protein
LKPVVFEKWQHIRRSKLFGNALALYASYLANYLVPLVTVPYTLRVLNLTGYGRRASALSFASLLGVVAGYGFNLAARARRRMHPMAMPPGRALRMASMHSCSEWSSALGGRGNAQGLRMGQIELKKSHA